MALITRKYSLGLYYSNVTTFGQFILTSCTFLLMEGLLGSEVGLSWSGRPPSTSCSRDERLKIASKAARILRVVENKCCSDFEAFKGWAHKLIKF